jgi:hypothetical protein
MRAAALAGPALLLLASLAGCAVPGATEESSCSSADAACVRPEAASLLPTEAELPEGFRAPSASEGGDAGLVLGNRSNPHVEADRALAWYLWRGGHPSIHIIVEDFGPGDLRSALPVVRVCMPEEGEAKRFLATADGAVAEYMFVGTDGPGESQDPPVRRSFDAMVDAIAARTGAQDACATQRALFPPGWEEPNDDRTQAREAQGYYDGLSVAPGDDDWFQAPLPKQALGHVEVHGDVRVHVEYANGTVVAEGQGGWWFDTERPADSVVFVHVQGDGAYTLSVDTGGRLWEGG